MVAMITIAIKAQTERKFKINPYIDYNGVVDIQLLTMLQKKNTFSEIPINSCQCGFFQRITNNTIIKLD